MKPGIGHQAIGLSYNLYSFSLVYTERTFDWCMFGLSLPFRYVCRWPVNKHGFTMDLYGSITSPEVAACMVGVDAMRLKDSLC